MTKQSIESAAGIELSDGCTYRTRYTAPYCYTVYRLETRTRGGLADEEIWHGIEDVIANSDKERDIRAAVEKRFCRD